MTTSTHRDGFRVDVHVHVDVEVEVDVEVAVAVISRARRLQPLSRLEGNLNQRQNVLSSESTAKRQPRSGIAGEREKHLLGAPNGMGRTQPTYQTKTENGVNGNECKPHTVTCLQQTAHMRGGWT